MVHHGDPEARRIVVMGSLCAGDPAPQHVDEMTLCHGERMQQAACLDAGGLW
jgi:hypothetical protein